MTCLRNNFLITGLLVVAACFYSRGQTKPEAAPAMPTRPLEVSEIDGGSASTSEYGTVLNKDTSLHRKCYILNDHSSPLQLSGAGVTVAGANTFVLKGDATTSAEISAIDVVAMLFDLWGDRSEERRVGKE